MGTVSGIRGIANKIKKFKKISQSLEDAEKEFKIELEKATDELEETKKEIRDFLDTLRKGK